MQIVKLMGGLGNQMFEYAFGLALENELKQNVYFDISWFDNYVSDGNVATRVFELDCFNIDLKFCNLKQVEKCLYGNLCFLPKFMKKKFSNKICEDKINHYQKDLIKIRKNAYFDGYFQTEKYFKKYRNEILKQFTLKNKLNVENLKILEQIKTTNSISLHVRRGDYLKLQNIYNICDLEYYKKAINYIAEIIEKPHFFLFSDDRNWIIQNLNIDYPFTVIDVNDSSNGFYDLELMKNCKHNIIANSSFSWWGAWLNQNVDKIVIAPKIWFNSENIDSKDIIPENWIKF